MKITIIGCGNMGTLLAQRLSSSHQLFLCDRNPHKVAALAQLGHGLPCPPEGIAQSDSLILAIKPQNLSAIASLIGNHLRSEQTLISLLTGISLSSLRQLIPHGQLVRMMPNLPIQCGEGVIGLCAEKEREDLTAIFRPLGAIHWIPEKLMNAFASLAGSGPGFLFALMESMIDAGIAMGFSASLAKDLTCQMVRGSATLLQHSSHHPAELRWRVCSPSGTTIAGMCALEEHAVRSGIIAAFLAAYEKAQSF